MGLSGRMLKPDIYTAVLQTLEIDPGELVDFQSMFAALAVAASKEGGYFDVGGAAGYTVVQYERNKRRSLIYGLPVSILVKNIWFPLPTKP